MLFVQLLKTLLLSEGDYLREAELEGSLQKEARRLQLKGLLRHTVDGNIAFISPLHRYIPRLCERIGMKTWNDVKAFFTSCLLPARIRQEQPTSTSCSWI